MVKYLFTDTDLAAQRLKVLAEVYAPSTTEFLQDVVQTPPPLAIDLGCGPGYTSHLLSATTKARQTIGLDNSASFIGLAQQRQTDAIKFQLHDITTTPFPVEAANMLYCRYLLTHLKNPAAVITNWASQLQLNGLLLIEETEWIESQNDVFTTYLKIVADMLAHQTTELYIGPMLNGLKIAPLQKVSSRVKRFVVPNYLAATMFYMNIQSWKHNAFIQENYAGVMIAELEEALKALASPSVPASDIEWGLRQLVFQKL